MAGVDIPRWMWALADDFPFGQPPPGVTPNFKNPQLVHGHALTIACSISIAFLIIFSSIRLYTKVYLMRSNTMDDYLFWVTLPLLLLILILYMYLDTNGAYGYHAWDLTIRSLTKPILVVTFVHQLFTPIVVWLVKATLMFLILNAFRPVKWLRILCYIGLVTTFIFYAGFFVIIVKACRPRGGTDRVSYLAGMASKECAATDGPIQKMSIGTGVFGVISDLYILLIPLPAVAKLKMTPRKKLGVYAIVCSGSLGCIAGIVSLAYRAKCYGTKDLTVDSIPNMTSHMVELSVGLIVTCMAPSAKFVKHFTGKYCPSLFGTTTGQSSNTPHKFVSLSPRRKHAPGGLSELDSMKTFGTTIDSEKSGDSSSMKNLTANASPYATSV